MTLTLTKAIQLAKQANDQKLLEALLQEKRKGSPGPVRFETTEDGGCEVFVGQNNLNLN